jgi:hypothetical protein
MTHQEKCVQELERLLNGRRKQGWDRQVMAAIMDFYSADHEEFARMMLPMMKQSTKTAQDRLLKLA